MAMAMAKAYYLAMISNGTVENFYDSRQLNQMYLLWLTPYSQQNSNMFNICFFSQFIGVDKQKRGIGLLGQMK